MRRDPPSPPSLRRPGLIWPSVAFIALMVMPAGPAIALACTAVLLRVGWHALARARAHRAERTARAAAGRMIPLGRGADGRLMEVPEHSLAAHALILGATGAGKSTTLLTILTDQIRRGRGVVAIDLKGSPGFAAELEAAAAANGRRFMRWSPDGQTHWNPLAAGNATELKDKLLATERFTEPHYRRAAERYLQLAIQVGHETSGGQPLTLKQVVALMRPEKLLAAARAGTPARAEQIREYCGSLTADQISAIRGLTSRLAILTESHTGPLLEPGPPERTLDLRRALDGGEIVLFSLNSSSYGSLAAMLGTLAVQDLVAASGARLGRGEPQQALIAIDEFSALQSDNVLSLMARGREAGMGVLLATQELADLDRAGRGFREQILGNTAVKIAHRQDVPESAETVARLAGTERVWEESLQWRPGGGAISGGPARSARLVDRYVVSPEQVRTLRTGEAVVVTKTPVARTSVTRVARPPAQRGLER